MSVVCIRANQARTLLFLFAATFLSPLLHIHAQPQCGGTTTIQVGCEGYGNTQAEAWANFMACVQNQLLTATQHGCQGKCPQVGFACRPMTIQFPPQLATYVQPQSGFSHGYFYTGPVTVTCGCMPDLCGNLIT
ncbi:MAG: hypothetical protein N2971_07020, partial [Chlorobi bacterium]|nr:hypothetical protein [Chlorobiota bacterium]